MLVLEPRAQGFVAVHLMTPCVRGAGTDDQCMRVAYPGRYKGVCPNETFMTTLMPVSMGYRKHRSLPMTISSNAILLTLTRDIMAGEQSAQSYHSLHPRQSC